MFTYCSGLTSLDVSSFNTGNVTDMSHMFGYCSGLTSLDVSNFNTNNVIWMGSMFAGCRSLTSLNVSNFNTAYVINIVNLFSDCSNLSKLTLGSSFATAEVQYCYGVFANCNSLNTITFTADIPSSINSKFFMSVGTADNPATLNVPTEYREHYAAKFDGSMFYGGYFVLSGSYSQDNGDLNGDSEVNGTDIVALINIIIRPSEYSSVADINGDGVVNGTDLVALVNTIMNNGTAKARSATVRNKEVSNTRIDIEPLKIGAGETREMTISLSNPDMDVTMMQLDMALPKGLRLKRIGDSFDSELTDRTSRDKHSLYISDNDGLTRILLASGTNAILDGAEGGVIRLTLTADNSFEGGDIEFKNMLCTSPNLQEAHPQSFTAHIAGNTTGIQGIDTEDEGSTIYNLSGQRVKATRKGLNIVNGKKMVVR